MKVNKFLEQYSTGKRAFPKINLQEAELIKVNLSNI
jgi:hypothetical protein